VIAVDGPPTPLALEVGRCIRTLSAETGSGDRNDRTASHSVASSFHRGQVCEGESHLFEVGRELRPGLAVAICTYERAESLARFLDSLAIQERKPQQLVIVDASAGDATERAVQARAAVERLADCLLYFRVGDTLKGLTRQRNFALRWVITELVAFFDDDIVLSRECLREMERAHREIGGEVAGVGALIENEYRSPSLLWQLRRLLRLVPNLQPGTYCRSGISIPWSFLPLSHRCVEGDWLPGCAMMWKADVVRDTAFYEGFGGYAQGEDLEFSLRAGRNGKLLLAAAARALHLHEPAGRPDSYTFGYMALYNRYEVHRRGLPDRNWCDVAWFIYAWTVDTLLLGRHFLRPGRWVSTAREIAGRLRAGFDIVAGRGIRH